VAVLLLLPNFTSGFYLAKIIIIFIITTKLQAMADMVSKNYINILQHLKERIRQARLRAVVAVNNELLTAFWEIGNTIRKQEKAEGWGTKTVDRLANDLKTEFPDMKGLSPRNLRYMREFVLAYPKFTILQRAVAKLPWGHNCTLLDKLKQPEERLFYARKAIQNGWTRAMLVNQIESGLH
jgi:predicted nuclease of restriction endonuclease-like (RecB) superfamily